LTGAADVALVKALGAGQETGGWEEFKAVAGVFVSDWLLATGFEPVMAATVTENVLDSVMLSLDSFTHQVSVQGGVLEVPQEVVLIPLRRALATFANMETAS
jgi:hypothetical protein